MQIGVVARGLSVDAIRFYERQRLITPGRRSEGGFRLFRRRDVEDLLFVRSAQDLGFSIHEIRDLLTLKAGASEPCQQVERLLETKLESVRTRIAGLQALEAQLARGLHQCKKALRLERSKGQDECPVLEQIAGAAGDARRK